MGDDTLRNSLFTLAPGQRRRLEVYRSLPSSEIPFNLKKGLDAAEFVEASTIASGQEIADNTSPKALLAALRHGLISYADLLNYR